MIYLDNAATTMMSDAAIEALLYASKKYYGNPSSSYAYGRQSKNLLEEARQIIANSIGALPEEIFFTSCGTESDNWVISQSLSGNYDCVITSQIEHHAILNPVELVKNRGIKTLSLPVDEGCVVKEKALVESLAGKKNLVSIMLQNNETGVIQPIRKFASFVHTDNPNSIFHTDAVQAIGHIRIDVNELGVDMLSASAHKFNGPKGVGFLYIRKGIEMKPFIIGGGQEKSFRSGTENVPGIYSMAKALEDNIKHIDEQEQYIAALERRFFERLNEKHIKYEVNGNRQIKAKGILNISINGIDGEGLLNVLDIHDVCISVGSACKSKSKEPSHVLTAMGLALERVDSAVRVSIGKYNTDEDIDKLIQYVSDYYFVATQSK